LNLSVNRKKGEKRPNSSVFQKIKMGAEGGGLGRKKKCSHA